MKVITLVLAGVALGSAGATLACEQAKKTDKQQAAMSVVKSPGKRVAAIDVSHRLSAKPAVGMPVELELTFSAAGTETLDIEINVPAALALTGEATRKRVAVGEPVILELLPQSAGRFYVNAVARMTDREAAPRVVSIPVQVGVMTRSASKAQRSASGELLIIMPTD